MTEYAEGSFNVSEYLSKRPQYPDKIYKLISDYHQSSTQTLLDLGCGPGQGSWPFLSTFDHVIGIDPGEGMIKHAREAYEQLAKEKKLKGEKVASSIYKVCSVESLDTLKIAENSIDLAIAATAAHWFDMEKTYSHLSKLIKKGGTVAFWTYDLAYPKYHPSTAEMVSRFAYEDLSEYVDVKGCERINSLYEKLDQPPIEIWKDVRHFAYPNFGVNKSYTPALEGELPAYLSSVEGTEWDWDLHTDVSVIGFYFFYYLLINIFSLLTLQSTITWNDLAAAKRTNSSYFNWRKEYPNVPIEKDIASRQVSALRDQVLSERSEGIGCETGESDEQVRLLRPMGLLLMRKR
ncbi:hypothetical protein L7F22_043909 [Adiantum nelumboides]|nr:hypothetical protein [Adiantum nelumboides]